MRAINSETELFVILNSVFFEVIEEVTQKILDKLIANIDEIVYIGQNKVYAKGSGMPTYEFRESWNANVIGNAGNVEGIIEQDYMQMQYDPVNFIHGSFAGDTREMLAQYLNEGTDTSVFGQGWWTEPRPYWNETLKLLDNGTVDKWIKDACNQHGLSFTKTTSFVDWASGDSK